MQPIGDLARVLGQSKRALHRRVAALGAVIAPHLANGKNGATIVDDSGIAILQRCLELERDGLSIAEAAHRVKEELRSNDWNAFYDRRPDAPTGGTPGVIDMYERLIGKLEKIITDQRQEIERLHDLLNRQLPPVSQGRMSRWQHFKAVLWGG